VSYILNIDTAVVTASICLSEDESIIGFNSNPDLKDHAAWIHTALKGLMKDAGVELKQLDAIAVCSGPGSYTGLRVGMATAKGLCYALQIPLITVNTLELMAAAAKKLQVEALCPMIDARRMEVFTALYRDGKELLAPINLILDSNTFDTYLHMFQICFFGNGSTKFRSLVNHTNASFAEIEASAKDMAPLSSLAFREQKFADLAYSEPFYGKEFYSPTPKSAR
jgi:tRNA threonylcarbamoyladenosine biosynthesis protein TsaB